MRLPLKEIEQAIAQLRPEDQQRLLAELPHLLKLSSTDLAYLRLAEHAFQFWDNSDDAVYDVL